MIQNGWNRMNDLKNRLRKLVLILLLQLTSGICAVGAMNLDSLATSLRNTVPDSTSLYAKLDLLANLRAENAEAKKIILSWLITESAVSGDYEVLARAYHYLGQNLIEDQRLSEAADFLMMSLEIAEKYQFYDVMAKVYNSYGILNYNFGQLDEAIDNCKLAIKYAAISENSDNLATYYYNLSGMYFEKGLKSDDTAMMAINVAKKAESMQWASKDTFAVITTKNGLSRMYLEMGQIDSALNELNENSVLIQQTGYESKYVMHYLRLAELYIIKKQFDQAIDYLDLGLQYIKKFNAVRWEYPCYELYATAYEGRGDYERALFYKSRYMELHDSILSQENYANVNEIKARYETEKKEKEILKLNKDNEIKQLKIQQEQGTLLILKVILASGLVIVLFLALLTVFLVRMNTNRKRANEELAAKNGEIQKQAVVLSQQSRLISRYSSQMNPHFVFNALNSIQGMVLKEERTKTIHQLQLLSKLMRETLNNSENEWIILSDEVNYLRRYLEFEQVKFQHALSFDVQLPADSSEILIPPMLIQPLLENSIKHARLHALEHPVIALKIDHDNTQLNVVVEDNGCGFQPSESAVMQNGHAISMICSRLDLIWEMAGATGASSGFVIRSRPEGIQGTLIQFFLPLNYKY